MYKTFNELWEASEQLHKESSKNDSINSIIDELILKINIYKVIDQKSEIPQIEKQKIKSHTMGEILLTLTNLSFKDNINVFPALYEAVNFRNAESFVKSNF
jgi:hypothetical protein